MEVFLNLKMYMRLDLAVAKQFEITREKAKDLIEAGLVSHLGKSALKPSFKINLEDEICLLGEIPQKPSKLKPSNIELNVVFEDEFMMIINKQAGVSTHPPSTDGEGTIANGVVNLIQEEGIRPGIVHRLDKDTTGLLIIAKTEKAKEVLSKMMERREIERRYLAICYGVFRFPSFQIKTNVIRDAKDRQKMRVCRTDGKEAITNVFVRESFLQTFSLVELKLETGRTHQIRLHLTHNGNSVVGDQSYGLKPPSFFDKFRPSEELYNTLVNTKRQMLHAFSISFIHPFTLNEVNLKVEPPEDFTAMLNILHKL
jgi:23S rRNA pseudouridine1911/1915/1917 synthase